MIDRPTSNPPGSRSQASEQRAPTGAAGALIEERAKSVVPSRMLTKVLVMLSSDDDVGVCNLEGECS
ncbi:MAG: hypothetical protein KF782_12615 [Labilithrix sp.]|nr:hypothetical protein [Labilithrix sp.]